MELKEELKKFFVEREKIGDLVKVEIPLLSLFRDSKSQLYIYNWVDYENKQNIWIIYKVSLEYLLKFLNGNLSQYRLIPDIVWVTTNEDNKVIETTKEELPSDYLPDKDVLFDSEDCPDLEKIRTYLKEIELKSKNLKKPYFLRKFNHLGDKIEEIFSMQSTFISQGEILQTI